MTKVLITQICESIEQEMTQESNKETRNLANKKTRNVGYTPLNVETPLNVGLNSS